MDNKMIRMRKNEIFRGKKGLAVGTFLLFMLISGMLSNVATFASQALILLSAYSENVFLLVIVFLVAMILMIGTTFFSGLLQTGYDWNNLDAVDGKAYQVNGMFQVFNKYFWKTIGVICMETIFILLWSLLLIVPGIMKAFSYAQALNILKDNPEKGVLEVITESKMKMQGKRGQLFMLGLYYVIWPLIAYVAVMIMIFASIYLFNVSSTTGGVVMALFAVVGFIGMLVISVWMSIESALAKQVFYRSYFPLEETELVFTDDMY